ncbi:MAG: transporter substrate-binding domain-containing protein [Pseudomonadaceae bacterium]|nr:transporter substrate-binding domain-containing protein [Pseudomonadaceae bacterium]
MKQMLLAVVVAVVASALTVWWLGKGDGPSAQRESAYERVMRTGVLRCGYSVLEPFFVKDVNTGKLSGVMYEYMQSVGKALDIQLEWTEEVGYGDIGAALASGRVDAFCAFATSSATRARSMLFADPIFYAPFYVYVEENDTRFDNNISRLNAPDIRFVALDGTTPGVITRQEFPKAKLISLPQLTPVSDLSMFVSTRKADAHISIPEINSFHNKHNKIKHRKVKGVQPLWLLAVGAVVAPDEIQLKNLIDAGTEELRMTQKLDRIIRSNLFEVDGVVSVAKPYDFSVGGLK